MASIVDTLTKRGAIQPPPFVANAMHYEVLMGSVAYGVSTDMSDRDVYGFCIPPKRIVFPHLAGEIDGFGRQKKRFNEYQKHHVADPDGTGVQYDLTVYNVVRYFTLLLENNPNVLDSLFAPADCVLHITSVGQTVRESRHVFLHKGCWHRFKGYAYSQLHKMTTKDPQGKRREIREQYGYDVKFAYHVVRLLDEVEQILTTGDLDLRRNREHMKAIRRGDVPEADVRSWAASKEKQLEAAYAACTLPYGPREADIKALLLRCLEQHYESLDDAVPVGEPEALAALRDVHETLAKYSSLLKET